jgi:hypothetical protein
VHRRAAGLAQDRWATEFETGLEAMLDRIAMFVADESDLRRADTQAAAIACRRPLSDP